jgi:hypothetical protein
MLPSLTSRSDKIRRGQDAQVLGGMGFEFKVLSLLGRNSTTGTMTLAGIYTF